MTNLTQSDHWLDADGNPAGGMSCGRGYAISWQNGPLGCGDDRREPNGAFVESVLTAVIMRMEFYQQSKFACGENAAALSFMRDALRQMERRTARREKAGTEGRTNV
jgi:hypothetical protein